MPSKFVLAKVIHSKCTTKLCNHLFIIPVAPPLLQEFRHQLLSTACYKPTKEGTLNLFLKCFHYRMNLYTSSLLLKQKLLSPSITIQSTLRDSKQPELQFRVCCLWKQFQGCPCLRQSSFVVQLQRSATLCVPVPARCPRCWQGDPDRVHSAASRVRPGAQCHSAVQWDWGRVSIKWWNMSWVTAFQVLSALILSLCGDS